jgi:hypothetical protein
MTARPRAAAGSPGTPVAGQDPLQASVPRSHCGSQRALSGPTAIGSVLVSVVTVRLSSPSVPARIPTPHQRPANSPEHRFADLESGLTLRIEHRPAPGHSRATSTGHQGPTTVSPGAASARGRTFTDGLGHTSKLVMRVRFSSPAPRDCLSRGPVRNAAVLLRDSSPQSGHYAGHWVLAPPTGPLSPSFRRCSHRSRFVITCDGKDDATFLKP